MRKFFPFPPICRRFFKPRCMLLNLTILIFIFVIICLYRYTILCSEWQVASAVKKLCQTYKQGKISGNMCNELCVTEDIKLGSCQTNHLAKDIVFEAEWNRKKIVIKSNYFQLSQYDSVVLRNSYQIRYPTVAEFTDIVANHIKYNFNISVGPPRIRSGNILTKLWSLDFETFIGNSQNSLLSAVNSIWSLVQQHEYVLMKYFEKQNVFPKIVGTCGHFYAMEYMLPLQLKNWKNRLSYALQLIEFSSVLETKFHQPLHLCDVKLNHFGLDSSNQLRVFDVDTAYFQSMLNRIIKSGKKCNTDADCSFWDCRAICHEEKKTCNQGVSNNNLQVICRKIFLGKTSLSMALKTFENGLLIHSSYNSDILNNLLEECASPSNYDRITNFNSASSHALRERLKLYLQNELNNSKSHEYL